MKKLGAISIALCLFLMLNLLVMPVLATKIDNSNQNNLAITNGSHSADAQMSVLGSGQITENIKSAFLYEVESDTLLHAWNADEKLAPASFAKIMTALVALENASLSDAITVQQKVLDTVPGDAVSADLVADEVLTLDALLYCMMVGSANDAAAVIAQYVCGSQSEFVKRMNQRAAELGCTGTNFVNPHGLHNEKQYTTARDTARILSEALKNEKFTEIFETVSCTIPATNKSEERNLITGNFMMTQDDMQIYFDSRVTGGRTGVANDGTRCLAVTAEANGMHVISVVMGSFSTYKEDGYTIESFGSYSETKALLDAAFTGYKTVQLLYDGQVLSQREVVGGGSRVSLGCTVSASTVLPENVSINQISYRYADYVQNISAPIEQGQFLSTVSLWYGNLCVAQADLYAMNDVRYAGTLIAQRETTNFNWWIILWILIGVAAVLVVVFIVYRIIRRFKIISTRKRSRRYRANRRRSR